MNINKAIKKQKKSFKRYVLLMGFIFFLLPIIVILTHTHSFFFMIYLGIIEILTILLILKNIDQEVLIIRYTSKLKIYEGIFNDIYKIPIDKIVLIHTMDSDEKLKILILLNSRIKVKKLKRIQGDVLKRYRWSLKYYNILKSQNKIRDHYYIILKKGGYRKYEVLDYMYKHCVQASFSDESIEKIKEYRK